MAQEQLRTADSSGGTQTTTQTPQSAGASNATTASASGVQPGTATSLLNNSQGGITLDNTQLSVVGLGQRTSAQTVQAAPTPPKHQTNPAVLGISVLLFVVAIAMFIITIRSSKTTT